MTKYFFTIIILFILFSRCGQQAPKTTIEQLEIQSDHSPVTNFDSITIALFDTLTLPSSGNKISIDKGHIKIFSDSLVNKIRPYFVDSFALKYSLPCFDNIVFAKLSLFSHQKLCQDYYVYYSGNGCVGTESDTSVAFLVPTHYQYRVKIPNNIWRQWLKELETTKTKNN